MASLRLYYPNERRHRKALLLVEEEWRANHDFIVIVLAKIDYMAVDPLQSLENQGDIHIGVASGLTSTALPIAIPCE